MMPTDPTGDWDHLSDEQLDRLTAYEADTARGVLALLDRVEKLTAKLDAIKRLIVQTNGDDRIYVDARELNPDAYRPHAWLLHWDSESGWVHGPSGESGTLGEMLHGIASCYVDRGEPDTLPPLIGEETEEGGCDE